MKTKVYGFLIAVACATCLGLVSCGSPAEDYTPYFVGTWELTSIEGSEDSMTAEEFAILKDLGITASLDLAQDGTCSLDLFGEMQNGTWEASAADAAAITLADQVVEVASVGETLELTQHTGQTLVFAKAQAGDVASSADEAADEAPEADVAAEDEAAEDAVDGEDAAGGEDAESSES